MTIAMFRPTGLAARINDSARPALSMQCGPSASWPVVLVPIGGTLERCAGVDDDDVAGDLDAEAIQATRRRAALLLTDPVVLRAVARALEPLRGVALRHAAAEVQALLVQRDDARLHPVEHGLGYTPDASAFGTRRCG